MEEKKKRRSVSLFLAALLGTAVAAYLFSYMSSMLNEAAEADGATFLGTAIGAAIVRPSVILGAIATVFAWVGWGTKKRGFALVAGILYAVACAVLPAYIPFHVLPMVLSFIGYGTMKK